MQRTLREERLTSANIRSVLTYLAESPYEHVFLTYLAIEAPPAMKQDLRIVFDEHRVVAVGYFGRHVVLASDPCAISLLAATASSGDERAIVGPRSTVSAYWSEIRAHHREPRLIRARQPVMAVAESSLQPFPERNMTVRPARDEDWRVVAENSAAMIAAELETDPREEADFETGIRRMIRMRLWWVGEREGRLSFFCNIGAWSPHTAQLQGIWTPPDLRRQGIAACALGKICRELFRAVPTLSLYVNDFNFAAIRLYQGLGFKEVGELQTILF